MKVTTTFNGEAIAEMSAAVCDFGNALSMKAARIAEKAGRDVVKREDVEKAATQILKES